MIPSGLGSASCSRSYTGQVKSVTLGIPPLEQNALFSALNDEAHWMINNSLTTGKTVPDFYNYIYLDGLKAVKPEAVSMSR